MIYQNGVSFEYNKIVSLFNEQLSGKFPFVDDNSIDKAEDVDEGTLKDFFDKFNKFATNDSTIAYIEKSRGETWQQPKEFIEKMINISNFNFIKE